MVKVQVTLVASPRNHLYRTGCVDFCWDVWRRWRSWELRRLRRMRALRISGLGPGSSQRCVEFIKFDAGQQRPHTDFQEDVCLWHLADIPTEPHVAGSVCCRRDPHLLFRGTGLSTRNKKSSAYLSKKGRSGSRGRCWDRGNSVAAKVAPSRQYRHRPQRATATVAI